MKSLVQILNLAIVALQLVSAETHCVALRELDQRPNPIYIVQCGTEFVEITASQYNINKGEGGQMQRFCPVGLEYLGAGIPMRWQTSSGLPEACDVYSAMPNVLVRNAPFVNFHHADGLDEEIDTSVHTLVYNGTTLVGFAPPVPGITIGP